MVYIITGGPGFGKTSVLNRLSGLGFPVCPEVARNLLKNYRSHRTSEQPLFPKDFEREVATVRLDFLQSIPNDRIAFSDRGLPDQIAFSNYKNRAPSAFLTSTVLANRYAPHVFVTPPWEEIYQQDEVRTETFNEALAIHQQIVTVYSELSYKIVNLPQTNVEERVRFIRNFLDI